MKDQEPKKSKDDWRVPYDYDEERPCLQLPLYEYPPEEYLRQLEEEEEKSKSENRVIIIDL